MQNLPDCFCDNDGMRSCDWTIELDMKYYRGSEVATPSNRVQWKLDSIPQVLAQAIFHTTVHVVNTKGLDTYLEWVKACYGENTPLVEHIKRTVKL